ncbi:MAG TPA: glycosyltransferase family 9 protein [Solirubrobacteraceae bacterium]|nr:glycosyltransferase family 9 protein [Solirubrobacteraceae bacterium]
MSARRVVALRALGLGDLLTGVPALRALRRAYPEHRITLAAPAALAPLAELTGAVDETVDAVPLAPLDRRLHGAAVAVNLHGRGPQSHRILLAARPGRLIAFSPSGVVWRAGEHEVVRWCRLLEESGIPAGPRDLRVAAPDADSPAPGATVIHPGAASEARRWLAERWAAVARAERGEGREVVVTGSAGERALAERVARAAGLPDSAVLAGRTSLLELAALIAEAGRVACGDTGVAHLATAFGTPSVVLFGPTPPDEWGPPDNGRHTVLWAGRRGDPHGSQRDRGLLEIRVPAVLDALAALPAARFDPAPLGR